MSKPSLAEPYNTFEKAAIEALLRGHRQWRPDLPYPESHSDMQAAVRGWSCRWKGSNNGHERTKLTNKTRDRDQHFRVVGHPVYHCD